MSYYLVSSSAETFGVQSSHWMLKYQYGFKIPTRQWHRRYWWPLPIRLIGPSIWGGEVPNVWPIHLLLMAIALVHELPATQIGLKDICMWKGSSLSERLIEIILYKKYNTSHKLIVEGTEALLLCLFLLYCEHVVKTVGSFIFCRILYLLPTIHWLIRLTWWCLWSFLSIKIEYWCRRRRFPCSSLCHVPSFPLTNYMHPFTYSVCD